MKKTDPDYKLKKQIEKLLFEDEFEGKTAKILAQYELTEPIRNWFNILIARKGAKRHVEIKP